MGEQFSVQTEHAQRHSSPDLTGQDIPTTDEGRFHPHLTPRVTSFPTADRLTLFATLPQPTPPPPPSLTAVPKKTAESVRSFSMQMYLVRDQAHGSSHDHQPHHQGHDVPVAALFRPSQPIDECRAGKQARFRRTVQNTTTVQDTTPHDMRPRRQRRGRTTPTEAKRNEQAQTNEAKGKEDDGKAKTGLRSGTAQTALDKQTCYRSDYTLDKQPYYAHTHTTTIFVWFHFAVGFAPVLGITGYHGMLWNMQRANVTKNNKRKNHE